MNSRDSSQGHGRLPSRRPPLDLSGMPAAWAPNKEFALAMNAGGVFAGAIEPYLNQIMNQASRSLSDRHPRLRNEIASFIRQETQHYKLHAEFDEVMYRHGFEELRELRAQLRDDLNRMSRERPLMFNLAYCVGFETFTLYLCNFIFGAGADLFEGADSRGADLWRWHMAEEYEHRGVCHEVYATLGGGYFQRARGFLYAHRHIGGYRRKAQALVMGRFRAGMSEEERRQSVANEKAFSRRMAAYLLPRITRVLVPGYDPMAQPPAAGVREALAYYPEV